jgi:hypothetical protein
MVDPTGVGCACTTPGSTLDCYSGPIGTAGVGLCKTGTTTCDPNSMLFGSCVGEVDPVPEDCSNMADDNCDGQINEGCPVTYADDVSPLMQIRCAPCHTSTTSTSTDASFALHYANTQVPSQNCPGLTNGACFLVRIKNGSMPQGAGCTGDPTADAANSACLTAAEQEIMTQWILGGQKP